MTAQAAYLPDGRLHLQHGPIDLIIGAEGPDRDAALDAAMTHFDGLLEGLVADLEHLRRAIVPPGGNRRAAPVPPPSARTRDALPDVPGAAPLSLHSPTARRMIRAVTPYSDCFVTPMAAVAGAVADEVLSAMTRHRLTKATVNNGGDIAFHLAPGARFRAVSPAGHIDVDATDPARGLATSGWRGRSHSLGIADAVTVLARSAAQADAAATLVANAVDLPGHPAITREPACRLAPDSDLGQRPVTTNVGTLTPVDAARALDRGTQFARACIAKGTILAASLTLAGQTRTITTKETAHA